MSCQSNTSLYLIYSINLICFFFQHVIHIDNGVLNKYNSIINKWICLSPPHIYTGYIGSLLQLLMNAKFFELIKNLNKIFIWKSVVFYSPVFFHFN